MQRTAGSGEARARSDETVNKYQRDWVVWVLAESFLENNTKITATVL